MLVKVPEAKILGRQVYIECDDSYLERQNNELARIASDIMKKLWHALTNNVPREFVEV